MLTESSLILFLKSGAAVLDFLFHSFVYSSLASSAIVSVALLPYSPLILFNLKASYSSLFLLLSFSLVFTLYPFLLGY